MPSRLIKKGEVLNPNGARRRTIASRDLPTITALAARGVRERDIARAVQVSPTTWPRLRDTDPAVNAAFEAGRQQMHDALVGKLYEKAMKGDTVALLFSLKVFFGYRENELTHDRPQINIINLPGAAPIAEYKGQTLEHEGPPALPDKSEVSRG